MQENSLLAKLRIDWALMLGLMLLSAISLLVLYSSNHDPVLIHKQLARLGISALIILFVAQIPPHSMKSWTPYLYIVSIILLALVVILGDTTKGATRWLNFGVVKFQPSELAKISIPLMLAYYFSERRLPPNLKDIVFSGAIIVVPVLLIMKQPDLGTAILIASSGVILLFLAGISWQIILTSCISLLFLMPAFWFFIMHDYQRQRVLTMLDPTQDPQGSGYHIIQSKIAIGSGGITGKGWLNGTQASLEYLPERSTDFIFAVLSEEFGFIGCLALLGIYLFVFIRGIVISIQAQDTFSRLLAGSISSTLFVYIFVNIGMVSGILPVVGVPLPLISYGGSSLITLMIGFGILMSIQNNRKLLR